MRKKETRIGKGLKVEGKTYNSKKGKAKKAKLKRKPERVKH